jgi:hypothetical protein
MTKNDTQPDLQVPGPHWERAVNAAIAGLFLSSLMLLPEGSPTAVSYSAIGIGVVSVIVALGYFAYSALLECRNAWIRSPLLAPRSEEPQGHSDRSHADETTFRTMEF